MTDKGRKSERDLYNSFVGEERDEDEGIRTSDEEDALALETFEKIENQTLQSTRQILTDIGAAGLED